MDQTVNKRIKYKEVKDHEKVFTNEFLIYLLKVHDSFSNRIKKIRENRGIVLNDSIRNKINPINFDKSFLDTSEWKIPKLPKNLTTYGIEISGPVSNTPMFINGLNPDKQGFRADGDLDDDEDSASHTLENTVRAAINREGAINRSLEYFDQSKNREYKIVDGNLPFLMHRERGLMLDEADFLIDGNPVSASILGTCLTLFYAGKAHVEKKEKIFFYLPKLESFEETIFWKDFFNFSCDYLIHLDKSLIKAIILVESLPAVFQMEEMLYGLGEYAAGLNAARWDLKASMLEFVLNDENSIWPDRFDIDIKKTPFLSNIFRRLVAICLKHGAVPIGGMATALPDKDPQVNKLASKSIIEDKKWEANLGFLRAWVAHIYHMKTAAMPFKEIYNSGLKPDEYQKNPDKFPVLLEVPKGSLTIEGTRKNIRTIIEYLEGWLNDKGAKGIDSLEGKPGVHPALMEDLATARISVAQVAQRLIHGSVCEDTNVKHDFKNVRKIFDDEFEDIIRLNPNYNQELYQKARKIGIYWVQSYTEFNFDSLGSISRERLDNISNSKDKF